MKVIKRNYGYISYYVEDDMCYILDIYVEHNQRRRGRSRELLKELIKREPGIKVLRMETFNYEWATRLGFKKSSTSSDVGQEFYMEVEI